MAEYSLHFVAAFLHGLYLKVKMKASLRADKGDRETGVQRESGYNERLNIKWLKLLDKAVFLVDGSELGKIEAINQDFVVIKRGSFEATRYYIKHEMLQRQKVSGYDYYYKSGMLGLDLTLGEAGLYANTRIPNPGSYVTLGTSLPGYFAKRVPKDD